MKKAAYIANGFQGIISFSCVQAASTFFIEEFGEDKISVANDAITIEIVADIRNEFLSPVRLKLSVRAVRVSLFSALPPGRNLDFFCVAGLHDCFCMRHFGPFVESVIFVEPFVI